MTHEPEWLTRKKRIDGRLKALGWTMLSVRWWSENTPSSKWGGIPWPSHNLKLRGLYDVGLD